MNFGFVSTRFSGIDGVSLESTKWAKVLEDLGHDVFWFSGLNDRPEEASMCVEEAYFEHPENDWINQRIWKPKKVSAEVAVRIRLQVDLLREALTEFEEKFAIDVLVPENAVTIPMHVPLGVAIAEFLRDSEMPSIAHHHDFAWERERFLTSSIERILNFAFPPVLSNMVHTVINSSAREELLRRKSVESTLIPNVFDFENPPPPSDEYAQDVRESLGLAPDDIFVLQPTRVVPRKGIEHAIKLVAMLENPKVKLVVSHQAGDEGFEYLERLEAIAKHEGVDFRIVADRIGEERKLDSGGRKIYPLWDLYPHCDLVTYPSSCEGFGNALLEAIYFKKPVMINRYPVFVTDIEPLGFQLAKMDGEVTEETVAEVERLLSDVDYRENVVKTNYQIGCEHFSYAVLRQSFQKILQEISILSD